MVDRLIPAAEGRAELTEKHSRFIGACYYTNTELSALAAIAAEKKAYPDARHHVYAYTVFENNLTRYSDDGEPQGTGGTPVLNQINGLSLTDCTIVVTRYFGGTLLGRGGLVRAYSEAAALAARAAGISKLTAVAEYKISAEYTYYEGLCRAVKSCGGEVYDTAFGVCAEIYCRIPLSACENFESAVPELTLGKARFEKLRETLVGNIISK